MKSQISRSKVNEIQVEIQLLIKNFSQGCRSNSFGRKGMTVDQEANVFM